MDLTNLTKEQLIALVNAQATGKMRKPVEIAFWPNKNRTLDWHPELSGHVKMKTADVADALAKALAEGKAEITFFCDGDTTDGSGDQPVVRGSSILKVKVPKEQAAA